MVHAGEETKKKKIADYNNIIFMLTNLYNEVKITTKLNEEDRRNLNRIINEIRFYCIKKVISIKRQFTIKKEVQKMNTNIYNYYKDKYRID